MLTKVNSGQISSFLYYLLMAVAGSLPFGRTFTSPLLILLFIIFFLYVSSKEKRSFSFPLNKKDVFYLTLPCAYYLLCILGLAYTSNLKEGFYELDKKIMLVAFPVLFLSFSEELSSLKLQNILKAFLGGVVACGIISIALGFYNSTTVVNGEIFFRTAVNDVSHERGYSFLEQVTQGGNYFFGTYISPFLRTNYYGLYLSIASILAFYFSVALKKRRYIFIGLFLFFILLLTDSRGPLISFLIGILLVSIVSVRNRFVKRSLPLIVGVIVLTLSISPRTSLLFSDFNKIVSNVNFHSKESAELRLVVWESAIEVIRKNPLFGVGTGDRENAMLQSTMNKNKAAFEMKLNAHNQYLEISIAFGIVGLLTLLLIIFAPLMQAIANQKHIFAAFLIIISLNMLFESMLQVFQGIVFFSFFYCVFTLDIIKKHETTSSG
jgi:O-antigen ligase